MKFRVKPTVSVFGVGTVEYHPCDVVEGPDEWVETNIHILEPIPELKPTPTIQAISDVVVPEVSVEGVAKPADQEQEQDGPEDRHATADRRIRKR